MGVYEEVPGTPMCSTEHLRTLSPVYDYPLAPMKEELHCFSYLFPFEVQIGRKKQWTKTQSVPRYSECPKCWAQSQRYSAA